MNWFTTHGVCTARRAAMADPMERQGVTRSVHHARRKNCRAAAHRRRWEIEQLVRKSQPGCFTAEGAENAEVEQENELISRNPRERVQQAALVLLQHISFFSASPCGLCGKTELCGLWHEDRRGSVNID